MWRDLGVTKLDLARYHERIGDWIVPHVAGRPLTLVRCPEGVEAGCQFMRHARVWGSAPLRRVTIPEKTKVGEYLVADTTAAVVALAQMGVVEVHTWNTRTGAVELPDRIVLDLDPGPAVPFAEVVRGARLLREVLASVGLDSWVKTTGGVGLHVVAPIRAEHDWSVCLAFAKNVARAIEDRYPDRYTTWLPKQGREKKILIDYLRNNRTNTSISAYSPRARAGAPVSTPVTWEELSRVAPAKLTLLTVPRRLARLKEDPWKGYFRCKQRLTAKVIAAVDAVANRGGGA